MLGEFGARHGLAISKTSGGRNLDALETGSDVALGNFQSLFSEIFEAEVYCIARLFKRLIEAVSLGDNAGEGRDDGGKANLGIGLQDNGEASAEVHSSMRLLLGQSKSAQARVADFSGPRTFVRGKR